MKKIFALTFGLIMFGTSAHAIDWWMQPTICRIDGTRCYGSLTGAGYDAEMWDAVSNCRGMKYICPEATTSKTDTAPVLMGRLEIANGTGINPDYDTNVIGPGGDCFGARRTSANGTMVSVNGKMVNVWCAGVLDDPDEFLENGEVEYDLNHPTCAELAANGFTATLDGKCYGKYYDLSQYYIECGDALMPTRLIVLNGADIESATGGAPAEKAASDALFEKMYSTSQTHKKMYFNNN